MAALREPIPDAGLCDWDLVVESARTRRFSLILLEALESIVVNPRRVHDEEIVVGGDPVRDARAHEHSVQFHPGARHVIEVDVPTYELWYGEHGAPELLGAAVSDTLEGGAVELG